MLCQECGERVEEGTIFCPSCGNWLRAEGHQTPAPLPFLSPDSNQMQREERSIRLWRMGILALALFLLFGIVGTGVLAVYRGLEEREQLIRERLNSRPKPTIDIRGALYNEALALQRSANWEEMLSTLGELQSQDPDFRAPEVKGLLFIAHSKAGEQLIDENRLKEAIEHFATALALKGDDAIAWQKNLASLYLAGTEFWEETNWVKAIESFTSLYQLEGDYKDVRQRLYTAHMSLGDVYSSEDAWCLAERHYAEAHGILPQEMVATKRDEATQRCLGTVEVTPKSER